MRPSIILPLLAIGANAAALHYSLPIALRHPPRFWDSHNRRQLHNADFSSTTAGPGAITNPVSGSSSSAASSLSSRSLSILSIPAVNGDPSLLPRADTGSRPINVLDTRITSSDRKDTSPLVSRQPPDPAEDAPSDTAADLVPRGDTAHPLVSRDTINLDALAAGSDIPIGLDCKRMVTADTPVNFPVPGSVSAASGRARNPKRALLDSFGSTTTLNCDSAQFHTSPDILHATAGNGLDIPMALPATLPGPAPSLPSFPRDISPASLSSERRAGSVAGLKRQNLPVALPPNLPLDASKLATTKRQNVPVALPVALPPKLPLDASKLAMAKRQNLPVTLPVALPLPNLPVPRDASVDAVSAQKVDSGVLSASVPRDSFVVRKEERL